MFAEFGSITEANVVYDRETGRSRGFGFVAYTEESAASDALKVLLSAAVCRRGAAFDDQDAARNASLDAHGMLLAGDSAWRPCPVWLGLVLCSSVLVVGP